MSLRTVVAENLHTMRKRKKLSQERLARKSRISVSYVSMLERGERVPTLDTLEALATALDVSPRHLLRRK
jgi:transcriptional regulator with XRE-family HTH domain